MGLTMQLIRAALGVDVHHRAHRVADGSVIRRRLNLELRDRHLRYRERHPRCRAVGIDIHHAVNREFVGVVSGAVSRKLRGCRVKRRLAQAQIGPVHRTRCQVDEVHRIAGEEGQFHGAALVHHLAQRSLRRVQQRRLRGHLHHLFHVAHGKRKVELHLVRHPHLYLILDQLLKASELGRHRVLAGHQVG